MVSFSFVVSLSSYCFISPTSLPSSLTLNHSPSFSSTSIFLSLSLSMTDPLSSPLSSFQPLSSLIPHHFICLYLIHFAHSHANSYAFIHTQTIIPDAHTYVHILHKHRYTRTQKQTNTAFTYTYIMTCPAVPSKVMGIYNCLLRWYE